MSSLPRVQRAVLEVLTRGTTHAYDIKLQLSPVVGHSSVYAALAGAEARGYVASKWEPPGERPPGSGPLRKYYRITALGEEALVAEPVGNVRRTGPSQPRGVPA